MTDNPTVEVPPTAMIPERPPEFSDEDHAKIIFAQASGLVDQYKRERAELQRKEQELQIQLTEAVLGRQGDAKKIDFLELENGQLRTTIQTLQADVTEMRGFMSKLKGILDRFGIKAPEKKPREKKARKKEGATA